MDKIFNFLQANPGILRAISEAIAGEVSPAALEKALLDAIAEDSRKRLTDDLRSLAARESQREEAK